MQEQKSMGRSIFIILVCSIGSLLLVSYLMPMVIDWVESPFMPQGVSCAPTVKWAINKMLGFQIASVIFGTVFGVLILYKLRKKSPKV